VPALTVDKLTNGSIIESTRINVRVFLLIETVFLVLLFSNIKFSFSNNYNAQWMCIALLSELLVFKICQNTQSISQIGTYMALFRFYCFLASFNAFYIAI
jgi:hypothetical protein